MIKLRDLEYLTAIDKYKHFGKAAQSCFVSQPTLSGQIMKLEQQLSLQLVERHRRNVMLTPAGATLVEQAKNVLQAAEQFEACAKALLDPLAGDLHLGLIPTLAPYLLPYIMADLNTELPNINFFLHENQTQILLQQLDEGQLDVLILPYLPDMEKFESYHLFDEPLVLATHATNKGIEKTLKAIANGLTALKINSLEAKDSLKGLITAGKEGDSPTLIIDVDIHGKHHVYKENLEVLEKGFNELAKDVADDVAKELLKEFKA